MQQTNLKIYGKAYKSNNGVEFTSYSYTKDGEKFYQVKFTKKCKMMPKGVGYYIIVVDKDTCSIQKGKKVGDKKYNDTLWINDVFDYREDKDSNEAAQRRKQEVIDELLD